MPRDYIQFLREIGDETARQLDRHTVWRGMFLLKGFGEPHPPVTMDNTETVRISEVGFSSANFARSLIPRR